MKPTKYALGGYVTGPHHGFAPGGAIITTPGYTYTPLPPEPITLEALEREAHAELDELEAYYSMDEYEKTLEDVLSSKKFRGTQCAAHYLAWHQTDDNSLLSYFAVVTRASGDWSGSENDLTYWQVEYHITQLVKGSFKWLRVGDVERFIKP